MARSRWELNANEKYPLDRGCEALVDNDGINGGHCHGEENFMVAIGAEEIPLCAEHAKGIPEVQLTPMKAWCEAKNREPAFQAWIKAMDESDARIEAKWPRQATKKA